MTLAHHDIRSDNPAPCNTEVEPLTGGTILISHIDLDTVGGIMAVEGIKPEDPEFWSAAEFIDNNGPHRSANSRRGSRINSMRITPPRTKCVRKKVLPRAAFWKT